MLPREFQKQALKYYARVEIKHLVLLAGGLLDEMFEALPTAHTANPPKAKARPLPAARDVVQIS